ncbi:MAG: hypothetical protein ACRDGD_05525 [Candidatus Limnocylindria bacterium]
MSTERIEAITTLLDETEAAHRVYESAELNGAYDQEWPRWYADYAVGHGIGAMVGHDVSADELATFLADSYADFERAEPAPTEAWAAYLARRIATDL